MPKGFPTPFRRAIQKAAIIAGAHNKQAAEDIRRTFKVEADFSPRKVFVFGIGSNLVAERVLAAGDIPVVSGAILSFLIEHKSPTIQEYNLADTAARLFVPLLLGCDAVAIILPGSQTKEGELLLDTADRYQIPRYEF